MSDVGPTIYARLMDGALAEPTKTIHDEMYLFIKGSGIDMLTARVVSMLKEAYVAGVQDGYRNAVMNESPVVPLHQKVRDDDDE